MDYWLEKRISSSSCRKTNQMRVQDSNLYFYYFICFLLSLFLLSMWWCISYRLVVAAQWGMPFMCTSQLYQVLSSMIVISLSLFLLSMRCISYRWLKHNEVCLFMYSSQLYLLLSSVIDVCLSLFLLSMWCISYRWLKHNEVCLFIMYSSLLMRMSLLIFLSLYLCVCFCVSVLFLSLCLCFHFSGTWRT